MTVKNIFAGGRLFDVTGEGYSRKGGFFTSERSLSPSDLEAGRRVEPTQDVPLLATLVGGALCNDAMLLEGGAEKSSRAANNLRKRSTSQVVPGPVRAVQGDPTEGALLVAAAKAGLGREELDRCFQRLAEIPFEPERRRMSVLVIDRKTGSRRVYLKGAPDTIVSLCTRYLETSGAVPMSRHRRVGILAANELLASRAQRVLAVAYRDWPAPGEGLDFSVAGAERDLIFAGLLGMIDPPRQEARKAVRKCRLAGLRPIMVTGDHATTARAVALELGLMDGETELLTGEDLDAMTDPVLERKVTGTSVFARVSPRHKLRIVRALKSRGHVVAMTGDGVNDAPAVKEAHIGIAMGLYGSDVTKEAADLVLLDDDFSSIVAAVEEGRKIYQNIRKFIRYLLSCNTGEILVMFMASLLGWPLPLLPLQILAVNLVTDGLPAIALGVDPAVDDLMREPPREPGESIFSRGLGGLILSRGILIGISTLIVFGAGYALTGGNLVEARTMAFATLSMSQLFHSFDCRSEHQPAWETGILGNPSLVASVLLSTLALLAVVYWPPLQGPFKTVPLTAADWVVVLVASGFGGLVLLVRQILSGMSFQTFRTGRARS